MKVLSLFDGISCARVALDRAGIKVDTYYASEIDKYAIQVSQKNYPGIVRIGDVTTVSKYVTLGITRDVDYVLNDIDLLIGGSPCQDLSIAKKNRKGLDGERSGLFWEYVRILKEVKPKYFILENVASMPKEAKEIISEALGVQPIMINAALVSAQNRKRLFWTNIPGVVQPTDREIYLQDILESGENAVQKNSWKYKEGKPRFYEGKCPTLSANMGTAGGHVPYAVPDKSYCIDANYHKGANWEQYTKKKRRQLVIDDGDLRKLTPIECERLQGLPDNYTEGVSNTQRYKCLGNAFNVDVVAHILSFIK